MNLINILAAAKAAFEGLMHDSLKVDPSIWNFDGLDLVDGGLVFRCSEYVRYGETVGFRLNIPAAAVADGVTVAALEQAAANDDFFKFEIRSLHDYMVEARLDRQQDLEIDLLMTEAELQDRDSRNYVNYFVGLGVDLALL